MLSRDTIAGDALVSGVAELANRSVYDMASDDNALRK
jgi:hypothetical protein